MMMKKILFVFVAFATVAAHAGQLVGTATVDAVQPQYVQETVPQQSCHQVQVQVQSAQPVNSGNVLGAIVGGLLGAQVGNGNGRVAAAAVGSAIGAMAGNSPAAAQPQYQYQTECSTVYNTVNQLAGWMVTYTYQGHRFTDVMHQQPQVGSTIRVEINVTPLY
jgi:uncharacterized protein YcfJ